MTIDKDWKKLSNSLEGDYNIRRHVRSKILAVYFPKYFLSMHANKQAGEVLESVFGIPPSEIDEGLFMKQAKLLALKDSHPIMKNWSIFDFSTFIWRVNEDRKKTLQSTESTAISLWVVRAGKGGESEERALNNNVVTMGFGNLSGIATIKDWKSFKSEYLKLNPDRTNNAQRQAWSFINHIKKGDLVLLPLKTRKSKFVAIGQIEGEFDFAFSFNAWVSRLALKTYDKFLYFPLNFIPYLSNLLLALGKSIYFNFWQELLHLDFVSSSEDIIR